MLDSLKENVNKYQKSYDDLLNNTDDFYEKVKKSYEEFWLVPIAEQIYTSDGGSIRFDVRKEESLKLESLITDYTTESNENLQSNISLKPIEITLTGLVGNKVVRKTRKNIVQKYLEEKLTPLDEFTNDWNNVKLNEFLRKTQQIQEKVDSYINLAGDGIKYLQNIFNNTDENEILRNTTNQILTLWKTRKLVDIQTNFAVLKNMAIQNVEIKQNDKTTDYIEIAMTFKQISFFELVVVKKLSKIQKKRTSQSNNGKTQGKDKTSFKKAILYGS